MNTKNEVAKIPEKKSSILAKMAAKFSVDGSVLQKTLADTVFKGASPEQTVALLIVADQYGLNPFTKEIYAFPAKGGGIVPVVGIDGWLRIINENEQFDGMEFEQDEESCTCKIYRKDRTHPITVTEYLDECKRNTDPWNTAPKRMLRHKSIIQCARVAFGFGGIHDEDEGKIIANAEFTDITPKPISMPEEIPAPSQNENISPVQTEPENKSPSSDMSQGVIDDVKISNGQKNGKEWTRYEVIIENQSFGTFSQSLGEKCQQLKGKQVTFLYSIKGQYFTLENVEVAA